MSYRHIVAGLIGTLSYICVVPMRDLDFKSLQEKPVIRYRHFWQLYLTGVATYKAGNLAAYKATHPSIWVRLWLPIRPHTPNSEFFLLFSSGNDSISFLIYKMISIFEQSSVISKNQRDTKIFQRRFWRFYNVILMKCLRRTCCSRLICRDWSFPLRSSSMCKICSRWLSGSFRLALMC